MILVFLNLNSEMPREYYNRKFLYFMNKSFVQKVKRNGFFRLEKRFHLRLSYPELL